MLHHSFAAFLRYIIKHLFHEYLCLLRFEHKNDVTIIITLDRASLTMIVMLLLCSKCNIKC